MILLPLSNFIKFFNLLSNMNLCNIANWPSSFGIDCNWLSYK